MIRIDAHHHFWSLGRFDYPWITPSLTPLRRDFGPKDLSPLLSHNGFSHTILVQTISRTEETRWFLQLCQEYPFIAGVVGWVDLADPAVGTMLDRFRDLPGRLVGIRHQVHDESNDNWLLRPEVCRGLEELSRRNIPFDLLIRPQHFAATNRIVRQFPNMRFVIDHIAKPAIATGRDRDEWAAGLRAIAKFPNVWCKLSGMITEADWRNWRPDDLKPYIGQVIEAFGCERLLFGSDWPVCLLAGTYNQAVQALEATLNALTSTEREGIFGRNAARFYGLDGIS